MNIIICGAGKVGFSISKQLSAQGHSITVIDQSSEFIQKINDTQDVKGVVGRATFPSVLEKAGAEDADMIIAVTQSDETNMVICQVAHSIFKISKKIADLNGINETKFDTDFDLYYKYDWPGNVRELRNLVERVSILALNETSNNINQLVHDSLSQKNISERSDSYENVLSFPLKEAREKFEKNYLTSQLKKHKGNISKTAEFIGMERSALHRKLKTLGVKGVN